MYLQKLRWSSVKLTAVILRRIRLRKPRYAVPLSDDAVLNFLLGYECGAAEGEDVSGRLSLALAQVFEVDSVTSAPGLTSVAPGYELVLTLSPQLPAKPSC